MEGGGEGGRAVLTPLELQAVAAAVSTVVLRCQQERALGRLKEQLHARRQRTLMQAPDDGPDYVATSEAVVQLCYALGRGVIPRATPRWWMKRRTGSCRSAIGQSSIHPVAVLGRSPFVSRDREQADETHVEEDNDEKQHDEEE
ncbi:hypothetical protein CBR_g3886 [Chara braunii]|uniref:Uncharacterized protein n=1 Tax=Chara braunii TaxID=69332 RepID=A0A388KGR2_CHABU|nr:hypothetical protein CBR_g3886 [Chara braunii]|eukprot:GBG69187.1 hypothetical protein CBR_g3886 [Chara braunii]